MAKKLNETQKRMLNLLAEEYAAAISLRDKDPNNRDMFAAGVADGMLSCASWLSLTTEVTTLAEYINATAAIATHKEDRA